MKAFTVFVLLFAATQAADEFCYRDVDRACKQTTTKDEANVANCHAKYGAIDAVVGDLQAYVNTHITRSFEYLLMSTHYSNYQKNREGFEKLFRDLSDDKWNSAIDLIKYIGKRGGSMNFSARKAAPNNTRDGDYELYEVESVAKALDIEKALALDAHSIHGEATRRRAEYHDPEISSYLEEHFVHKHSSNIRKLSGYAHDLLGIMDGPERSLGLYFFDEYLQKQ